MADIFGVDVAGSDIKLLNTCADKIYVLHSKQELRAVKQNPLTITLNMGQENATSKPYMHTLKVGLPHPDAVVSVKPIDNITKVSLLRICRTPTWELYLVSSLDAADWKTGSNAIARSRIQVKTYVRAVYKQSRGGYGFMFYNSGVSLNSNTEFLYPMVVANLPQVSAAAENRGDLAVVFSVQDMSIGQYGGNRPWSTLALTNGVKWSGGKVHPTLMGFGANWYNNQSGAWGYFNVTADKNETWGNIASGYGNATGWYNAMAAEGVTRGSVMLVKA